MADISRRSFLGCATAAASGLALGFPAALWANDDKLPITGSANPDLEPFDTLLTTFVKENKVPGASLAVTRNGKLVYARGFGHADVEKKEGVEPSALFRIASVSKPITGVAIMQLAEKKLLKLDDRVVDLMKLKPLDIPGKKVDERWRRITVRQCLQHTGGWDRGKSYDPIGRVRDIAKAFGVETPVNPEQIVRYMMSQPLDLDPGLHHRYSNLGYLVLGRIIEAVTGQKYEAYVKKEVLAPLGIKTMQLGHALVENRVAGEVRYYDSRNRTGPAIYPPRRGEQVPVQYGVDNIEGYEAHGGWIGSAVDLVRFASAFDDPAKSPLLSAKSIEEMWRCPEGEAGHESSGKPKATYYGCGWMVRPVAGTGKANTWHTGFIAGSEALLVRRSDGLNWAVLFNTAQNPAGMGLSRLIDGRVHEAADRVKRWPDVDLFEKFSK